MSLDVKEFYYNPSTTAVFQNGVECNEYGSKRRKYIKINGKPYRKDRLVKFLVTGKWR